MLLLVGNVEAEESWVGGCLGEGLAGLSCASRGVFVEGRLALFRMKPGMVVKPR